MVEKFMIEKFMVEKFIAEKFMIKKFMAKESKTPKEYLDEDFCPKNTQLLAARILNGSTFRANLIHPFCSLGTTNTINVSE